MLQNRVDPFGHLITTKARGGWMGNRGLIHNDRQEIVRPFKLKSWITCELEFKGRRRQVMSPGLYTELFFLDEATAFAAGHRPCFECRREKAMLFKRLWLKGNPEYGFDEKTAILKIDEIIHEERISPGGAKASFEADANDIPNGSFILIRNSPYLVMEKQIYLWTPSGYDKGSPLPLIENLTVLTPRSIVNCFSAGYRPQAALRD